MIITVPVTFDAANRRKDKSVSMRFTSNLEVSNADFATMDLYAGREGWLAFKDNEISEADIPKENAPSDGKSMRDRMRATHWVYWDTNTDKSVPFPIWYDQYQEAYIQRLKDKLPERG
jgi:hypothetical protein